MTKYKLLINGELVEGDSVLDVVNPATESIICQAPRASKEQFSKAIKSAKTAYPAWAKTSIEARAGALITIADALELRKDELISILIAEQGKPLLEASGEVNGMIAIIRRISTFKLDPEVLEESAERRIVAQRISLGVVGAILPWNFPLSLIALKLPSALLAGNTIILKPAPTTPLGTLLFGEIISNIVPPGVINVVTDNNDLGHILASHPDVRKVSFTGSTATGKKVMATAADTVKRVTLEMGGNDAAIVLDDVNVAHVAPDLFRVAFTNAGQLCMAVKRVYAHADIYDELCQRLADIANAAIVDDGTKPDTDIGPLQNYAQFDKVKKLIESARREGSIIAGGQVPERKGYFIRPTIVNNISDGTELVDNEQFGPILPIVKIVDEDDGIRRANASSFGLGASVWSSDLDRAQKVAACLEVGTVWINKHYDLDPSVPFGGAKESGIGAEMGQAGLHEFTQLRILNMAMSGS